MDVSHSVLYLTSPADERVQLDDTYSTFSIIKASDDCAGYILIELRIGRMIIRKRNLMGYHYGNESWNINLTTSECNYDGIYTAQLNVTFNKMTLNGIFKELAEVQANTSSIAVQFIYRNYIPGYDDSLSQEAIISIETDTNAINHNDNGDQEQDQVYGSGEEETKHNISSTMQEPLTTNRMEFTLSCVTVNTSSLQPASGSLRRYNNKIILIYFYCLLSIFL